MRSGWTPATPGASLGRRDPTAIGTLDTRVCTASATLSCPAISVSYTANGTIHEPGPGHNSRDGSTNTDADTDSVTNTLAVRGGQRTTQAELVWEQTQLEHTADTSAMRKSLT